MCKSTESILVGIIAFIGVGMFRNIVPVSNMLFFVLMCIAFLSVTLLSSVMIEKKRIGITSRRKAYLILPILFLAAWMVLFFVNETKIEGSLKEELLIRSYFPLSVWLLVTGIGTGICLLLLNKSGKHINKKYKKILRAVVTIIFSVATSVQFYAPNIFQDVLGGTYHSHAYTNPIINVCRWIPYGDHMEALYGHYAILFMPILKVMHKFFHIDYLTGIFIVVACIVGISIWLFAWVINYFAKNELIFYLSLFAIGEYYFMLMRGGVYLQVHPHRMIFPILLTALALLEYRQKKHYDVIAIVTLSLSLVWSTEVGLVMMVAFTLYRFVQHLVEKQRFTWKDIRILKAEFEKYFFLPFVFAYVIVNAYNVVAGGMILNLKAFLFPLISERGYISQIELPLPDVTHAWIGTAVLFLIPVGLTALVVWFPQKNRKDNKTPFYFLIGIMGLGLMLYYINRPVEGSLFLLMYLMLILQTIILQRAQDEFVQWKKDKRNAVEVDNRFLWLSMRVITVVILFTMSFDSLYSMPDAWKQSKETIWKRQELFEFAQNIGWSVEPTLASFGEGVPELLSMIDRDTYMHTTEWSYKNMPLDTMEKIRYDLEETNGFFCNMYSLWIMQEEFPGLTEQFELYDLYEYNGVQFGVFKK